MITEVINLANNGTFFGIIKLEKCITDIFYGNLQEGSSSDPGVISMGANNREDGIDLTQFGLPLAFILGIIGMLYHGYRDEKMAFSVMALFIMTGYAIILYLNQDNPQPRERDYSYVGSFFAFSILIVIGNA